MFRWVIGALIQKTQTLGLLDLRGNALTMEGMREIQNWAESNKTVDRVEIKNETKTMDNETKTMDGCQILSA